MKLNSAQVKPEFLANLGLLTSVIERLGIVEKVNVASFFLKKRAQK
jgi:hypothetical protein